MQNKNIKILVISSYDLRRNTSSNIRTIGLMQSLKKKGHTIHCLFIDSNKDADEVIGKTLNMVADKVILLNQNTDAKQDSQQAKRAGKDNLLSALKNKIRTTIIYAYTQFTVYDVYQLMFANLRTDDLRQLDDDYDIVISSSEPRSSHKLASIILRKMKIKSPWIQYWGDPMTNDVAQKDDIFRRKKKTEHKLLCESAVSLYTNPIAAEYMKQKYEDCSQKIYWIPTTDIDSGASLAKPIENKFKVAYIGDYLSKFRNLVPFYEACIDLNLETIIVGNSDIVLEEKSNVKLLKRVPKTLAEQIENSAEILVVLENKSYNSEEICIQVPGKLYHYALSSKKVVVIQENKSIEECYGRYGRFYFTYNNKDEIKTTITRMLSDGSSYKPLDDFTQSAVAARFEDIVERI